MRTAPMTPTAVITQKVARQPKLCPIRVPAGTPATLAKVRPVNIIAMAPAPRPGATTWVATIAPTAKKVPCANAATTRESIRSS